MDKESLHHKIHATLRLQIQNRNCNNTITIIFFEIPVLTPGSFTNAFFWGMTLAPFYSEHASHRFLQNTDTFYQTKPTNKPNHVESHTRRTHCNLDTFYFVFVFVFKFIYWHGYVLHEGITYKSRVPRTSQMTSRLLRHTAAAMHAHNMLCNSYNTRPLLCARIMCYVTVITHGRCYARI
jgi:hypothetical protein